MMKGALPMKKILSLTLALLLALLSLGVTAEDDEPMASSGYYYVYTENGKTLNVRESPGGTVVGALKYGSKIYCYYNENGWALIDYTYDKPGYGKGTYACFVSSRYLRKSKPGPKPSATTAPAASGSDLDDLNAEFASAVRVTPYQVTVRPTRASGWVNLRWAPSKEAAIMATYRADDQLTVIQELKNWLQVEDPATGDVGFISKSFVQQ